MITFEEMCVVVFSVFKNAIFCFTNCSQRLSEYRYFWNKTLLLLTFTKRELTSIKHEVCDNFQNWTSLKGEVFLQMKSLSDAALAGLLHVFTAYLLVSNCYITAMQS